MSLKPTKVIVHTPAVSPSTPQRRRIGLGDAMAAVAQPIAKAVDAVLGTNLQNCASCGQRQESLNKAVDNINPFAK